MKVYTNNLIEGHYLTGSAVVVALDPEHAAALLEVKLDEVGLRQVIDPAAMIEINTTTAVAIILNDGNY